MTSMPWMKDVSVAIADPINPVAPEDKRQSVKALIEEYRAKIDKVKAEVSKDPLYDEGKHDDLWLLRFCLSHKKSKKAIAAAKHTFLFRQEHKLDEKDIREYSPHKMKEGMVHKYWKERAPGDTLLFSIPDKQRGVVCFIAFASMRNEAVDTLTVEEWDYAFIYSSEWCFQWLDYVTRTTGRLTKSIRFIDLSGISLSIMNRRVAKRDGDIMGKMEDVYPQSLESIKVCNAPAFIHIIWAFFRPIMPERIVSKVDIINPSTNEKERSTVYQYISAENLPTYLGGKNNVPPSEW